MLCKEKYASIFRTIISDTVQQGAFFKIRNQQMHLFVIHVRKRLFNF